MNRNLAACVLLAASLGGAGQARAQAEWTLVITDTHSDSIDLLLTTSGWGDSVLTGVGGTFNGVSITGLSDYAAADDLLFATDVPPWDFSGISFTVTGGAAFNIGGKTGFPLGQVNSSLTDPLGVGGLPGDYAVVSESLTQIPEPASAGMLTAGLMALGAARRWKRSRLP